MEMSLDSTTVTDLVGQLRDIDPSFRVFGSDQHRYRFNAPLDDEQILEFEQRSGVQLPNDYRHFFTCISNGGAGPNYGVQPFAEATIGCSPSTPFPSIGERHQEPIGSFDYSNVPGAVWLSDNGCATFDSLIVNGESFGKVWTVLEERDYCRSESFTSWYVGWARSAINTIKRENLLQSISCGMTLKEVREILGSEIVPNGQRYVMGDTYWLVFRDCNAQFEFSCSDRVLQIRHDSQIIVPRM